MSSSCKTFWAASRGKYTLCSWQGLSVGDTRKGRSVPPQPGQVFFNFIGWCLLAFCASFFFVFWLPVKTYWTVSESIVVWINPGVFWNLWRWSQDGVMWVVAKHFLKQSSLLNFFNFAQMQLHTNAVLKSEVSCICFLSIPSFYKSDR